MEILNSFLLQVIVFSVAVIILCELCICKILPFTECSGASEIGGSKIGETYATDANESTTNTRNTVRATYLVGLFVVCLTIFPLNIV